MVGRQADSALSQAEGAVSQAFRVDSTLPQAESMVSQAGNLQASPADSSLSQAESEISQAGHHQATPTVRHSPRLRASHASPNSNSQAGSSQAGNTPWQTVLSLSKIVKPPRWALPRPVLPQ